MPLPDLRCGMYRHGHNVHLIQAKLAMAHHRSGVLASAVAVDGEHIEVTAPGTPSRYWNHRPDLIEAALRYAIGDPELLPHGVLAIPQPAGWATFSVTDTPTPCGGSGALDVALVRSGSLPALAMCARGDERPA